MLNNKVYYIMGTAGSGKTTIGKQLARELDCPYYDGDDFHPATSISKMKAGIPLMDNDRVSWLLSLNKLAIQEVQNNSIVISCSALKERYRQVLQKNIESQCMWIYLKGDFEIICERMKYRTDHFMPVDLLKSQFDALEEPAYGTHINIELSPEEVVQSILKKSENED